jgi:hypothetical protein
MIEEALPASEAATSVASLATAAARRARWSIGGVGGHGLPPVVFVECLQHFKQATLGFVEHGGSGFAADLDREQKISDRDDVAQAVAGALSACSWSVMTAPNERCRPKPTWRRGTGRRRLWQVPAGRSHAGSGRLQVRAQRQTSVNFSTGPTGLFSWQVVRESFF